MIKNPASRNASSEAHKAGTERNKARNINKNEYAEPALRRPRHAMSGNWEVPKRKGEEQGKDTSKARGFGRRARCVKGDQQWDRQ